MLQIEKQREDYYRKLGTPPGVPTMKGATADPDNTGYGYNTIIGELGDHSVPEGWVQRPKFNDKGDVPGPPIQWQKPEDPDNAQPGYGYVLTDTTNTEEIFFYHSDHLGSTSYITDAKANITQFDAYLPYGELLVDEHSSSEDLPYKFNGKEFDQETGLYYYGARYMNPRTSLWYGVDPLAEKYPSVGGYVYCVGNPVNLVDLDGEKVELTGDIELALQAIKSTLPQNLRKFIKLQNNVIDVNVMKKGIDAMVDNPSGNFKALYEIAVDDRTIEFSIAERPNAVNSSGEPTKDLIPFGPTEFFPEDAFGNKAEWITQGGTSISLAPKKHHWTKWDLQQRAKLTNEQMQFSPNENYQVQINRSMFSQKETLKNAAQATTHELYGHILFMFRGWDSSHGVNRKTDNIRLENWLIDRANETDKNFNY